MIEYEFNNQMSLLAKEYGLSFDNDYSAVRLPKVLKSTLREGIQELHEGQKVYYMIKSQAFCNHIYPNKFEFFYEDLTGNEASNNKVIFEIGRYKRYALKKGILFCHKLYDILPDSHEFCIIMGVDENYVTISFHMVRDGESWLGNDLEAYKLEAILVMNVKR